MSNNMAFSLIFKIVDGATAKIKEIAQAMAEPIAATEALGDASEASSARQVSAMAKARAALSDLAEGFAKPAERMAELGKTAGEAAEKFSKSFAGIGAIAAEGFSAKDVAQQEEFFKRLQINAGMARDAMEELREAISRAADQYAMPKDKMFAALQAYREQGGDPAKFGANAGNVAATLQLTQMDPEHAGQQLASLARLGITDPKQVISVLAQMREQLGGVPERMDAAAEASGRLVAVLQSLHMSGAQGALALNAVYGVAARSTGNARLARSETDNWLSQLADRGYQAQLSQAIGKKITDDNGFVMDPRVIMQMLAEKYAAAQRLPQNQQAVAIQRLNALVGDDAAKMFRSVGGEIATTGHSSTIEQVLGAKGDTEGYLKSAADASDTLSGAMSRLRIAMDQAGESVLTGPINALAWALNHCNGAVADLVIGVGGIVTVGVAFNWVTTTVKNLHLFATVLGLIPKEAAAAAAGTEVIAASGVAAEGASVGFAALGAALEATPIGWIITGVGLIVVGLYELYEHWTTVWWAIKNFYAGVMGFMLLPIYELFKHWKDIWAAMPGPVKAVCGWIESAWSGTVKVIGALWSGLSSMISGVWDGIKSVSAGVFDWFHDHFSWVFSAFKDLGDSSQWWAKQLGISLDAPSASGGEAGASGGEGGSKDRIPSPEAGATGDRGASQGNGRVLPSNILDYWRKAGLSDDQARGITAGIKAEGGSLGWADNGAFGIGQWRGSRRIELMREYGAHPTLMQQLDFLNWELHGGDRGGAAVLGTHGAANVLGAYIRNFMRPASGTMGDLQRGLAALGEGGMPMKIGGAGSAFAANDTGAPHPLGVSSIYGNTAAVPQTIFGRDAGLGADAPSGGSTDARAHLTIEIKDSKRQTSAHLDHTANMDAHLDRGPSMSISWG